jgi:hypothetical protein
MTKTRKRLLLLALPVISATALAGVLVATTPPGTLAQGASRTWVSGVGDDVNPCSRTAPCKTFAGAISKTTAGGEINVLDPGGFGAVTITKSITISSEGFEAGVLVSGTNGIVINAGSTNVITLRGLDIEGLGTGLNGIKFLAGGALHVQNSTIRNFRATGAGNGNGIYIANSAGIVTVDVTDTIITDNGVGSDGGGIRVAPSGSGAARVTLTRVQLSSNSRGVVGDGSSTSAAVRITIVECSADRNTNAGFAAVSTGSLVELMIDSSSATYNAGAGVTANGASTTARVGRSSITGNATGALPTNGGTIQSYQTNQIRGNTSNGTWTAITQE